MEIKTYGANKIGGCITEISKENTRIIFDYGKNLDDTEQIELQGLTIEPKQYDAVFISHYHLDHIGEIRKILKDIPIYIEKTTKELYDIICDFSSNPTINAKTFRFGEEITIGDLVVKSYKVDHSAYNSAMFLIKDKLTNETILYTGDFRDNGYFGDKLIPTLEQIGKIDYLIVEGTNIKSNSHIIKKEESLVKDFEELCNKYEQVFVLMSASNIDRISTMYNACKNTDHILIQDIYMAHLTSKIYEQDGYNLPNPTSYNDIMVYKPKYLKRKKTEIFKNKYLNEFSSHIKTGALLKPFVMNIRTSMLEDLKTFNYVDTQNGYKKKILSNACLVHSMWSKYKKKEDIKKFREEVKKLDITLIEKDIHTSGHASEELIKNVIEMMKPKKVYIIHTESNKEE